MKPKKTQTKPKVPLDPSELKFLNLDDFPNMTPKQRDFGRSLMRLVDKYTSSLSMKSEHELLQDVYILCDHIKVIVSRRQVILRDRQYKLKQQALKNR